MDVGKEFIEKIEEFVERGRMVEIDGRAWSTKPLSRVIFEPKPAAVTVSTLTGIRDFLEVNVDGLDLSKLVAHIEDVDHVTVFSPVEGEKKERSVFIEAVLDKNLKTYPFEKYLTVEAFVIALRTHFEPSERVEKLTQYVSKVRGGSSFELDDDGITQMTSVQVGVSGAITKEETAPVIVKLRPFRTFREIHQVESEFLFRMKLLDESQKIVGCTLYEADGGRWRNETVLALRDFLREEIPDLAVIA